MDIGTLLEKLEQIEMSEEAFCNPDVYIRIGLNMVKVSEIKYYPETDAEEEAVVIM